MNTDDVLALAGRLFIAMIFLASAFGQITNFGGNLSYMEAHGLPAGTFLLIASIGVQTLGSIALILGYRTRWGAAGLSVFLIAATWAFHTAPDQRIQLLKNLAILGGLLNLVSFGPGPISLEGGGRSS